RDLHRFVDHSHAAPADLADNAKIPQRAFRLNLGTGCYWIDRARLTQLWSGLVNKLQTVETLRQGLGDLGIAREKRLPLWFTSGFERGPVFFEGADHWGVLQPDCGLFTVHRFIGVRSARMTAVISNRPVFAFLHEEPPSERRKRARARAQRFFTLLTLRPMRLATSGKLSP